MTADALIVAAGAAAAYGWLCAAVTPVGLALNHLIVMRGARRAWPILLLAAGGSALWTLVGVAAALVSTVVVPAAALAVLLSAVTIPAVSLGVMLWAIETSVTARLPRIGPAFELATALAPLCVAEDAVVAAAEREYGAFLADEAPSDARSGARRLVA